MTEKMTDSTLAALLDDAASDSIFSSGTMNKLNERLYDYYNSELFGDEEEGRSSVVSTDVADTVDADMTSLARVFLGAGDIAQFEPISPGPDAAKEADDKNKYINWVVANVPGSYKKQMDWLKDIALQKTGYIEYGIRDETKTEVKSYFNINQEFLTNTVNDIENTKHVDSVEVVEAEDPVDGVFDVKVKIKRTKQVYFIENVANEDLIITRNIQTKNQSAIFGKYFRKTRSDLIAEGFDKDLVARLPKETSSASNGVSRNEDGAKSRRYKEQGGEDMDPNLNDTASDIIKGMDVYTLVDFDGDGITERRHVIKVGKEILLNEAFDHIPYAGCSAIQASHNIIGKSRGELSLEHQRVNSVLCRNMLDNTYQVNLGRAFVNETTVDLDDYYAAHKTGVIRVDGDPNAAVANENVPYTGDMTMQVMQFQETKQAKSTGNLITNQALSSDTLNDETATRFRGVEAAGTAKIELVARNIAEIGYVDLYDGLAWFASHYQNDEAEILVLGQPLTVNPNQWKFEHRIKSAVGTGAGDDEKTLETLSGVLAIQDQEIANQTGLADFKTKYNTLNKITKAAGLHDITQYFNDPTKPEQQLQFENQQLTQMVQQLQQAVEQLQQTNPLVEMEAVKNEGKRETDNKKLAIDAAKIEEDARQFDRTAEQKDIKERNDMVVDLAKLDIDGQSI